MIESNSLPEQLKDLHNNLSEKPASVLDTNSPVSMYFKTSKDNQILYTAAYAGEVRYLIGDSINVPHKHAHFELMYVLHGSLTNYIEDKTVYYRAGDGCLMNRQINHYEVLDPACSVVFVNFSPEYLTSIFNETFSHKQLPTLGPLFEFLRANIADDDDLKRSYVEFTQTNEENRTFNILLDSLQLELSTSKLGASYFQKGLSLRIIDALQNNTIFFTKFMDLGLSKEDFLVAQVLNALEKRMGNITRAELSEITHYNDEHLNRVVKKNTGLSIMKHAKKLKIKHAMDLLAHTDMTISDISSAIGFTSESHFYRFFKENLQQSPDQFRQEKSANSRFCSVQPPTDWVLSILLEYLEK
jgi:AraC-like DNA-binding protein